ncbi:hypothetical protein FQA39_LY18823 [Lamprigera yunnana]|nr:hypothetical protein FQA39_LY18823 [Lamprigera yunnana]
MANGYAPGHAGCNTSASMNHGAGLRVQPERRSTPRGVHARPTRKISAGIGPVHAHSSEHGTESMTGVDRSVALAMSSEALEMWLPESRGVLDAASKRELAILRRLEQRDCADRTQVHSHELGVPLEEEVVRITNEEFVTVKRDDLAGNFDLSLTISTAEEDNAKADQLAFMLQTVGPQEDPSVRRMILADICRLRKMPDLAKKLEDYEPQPDPLQQEKIQLEIELGAELAIGPDQYGTGQNQGQIKSAKDLMDLDFIEQECWLKQERDLQKQGAQAQAQERKSITEHQLNQVREDKKAKMN